MLKLFFQLVRFAGIGFLNTAVDYAVFNFVAAWAGVYTGGGAGLISGVSFTIAVFHSYFWNKYWAFGKRDGAQEKLVQNLGQFVTAAALGAAVVAIVIFGTSQKYHYLFYLLLFVLLLLGELGLWKVFSLKKNAVAAESGKELLLFLFVSVVGILLNSQIVNLGTSYIPPQFGLNQELWTNLIKVGATGVSLIWNFAGYKLFVFKG